MDAGADKDKAKNEGVTPLYKASSGGHLEVVRALLQAGADKDKAWHYSEVVQYKPIDAARQKSYTAIVRLLEQ